MGTPASKSLKLEKKSVRKEKRKRSFMVQVRRSPDDECNNNEPLLVVFI